MKRITKIILLSVAGILVVGVIFAKVNRIMPLSWGHQEVNYSMFSNEAINGYDPVAYFTEGQAVLGSKDYSYQWKEADWYFSSEENKSLFIENPKKYIPQYGGYCGFAISKGFTANTDPTSFEILDDKLYLFANEDVKKDWKGHLEENLQKCNENWK